VRGFDLAVAGRIFEGTVQTIVDDRYESGEERFMAAGHVNAIVRSASV
jgi:uncharacterized DUF497 family protein